MKSETFNEDCMAVMARYPDKYFDLCVTDPPYGVNLQYNTYADTPENWYKLMSVFIPEVRRICKMVIMPSCSINKLGWIYKNHEPDWLMCWYKGSPGHNSWVGFNDWEPLLVYGKVSGICIHDYFKMTNTVQMGDFGHACPKPVNWSRSLIHKILGNTGVVFDPFLGSGSSRIACWENGNDFVGCEIDKDYFDASEARFKKHISQQVIIFPTIKETPTQLTIDE